MLRPVTLVVLLIVTAGNGLLLRYALDRPASLLTPHHVTAAGASYRTVQLDLRTSPLRLICHNPNGFRGVTMREAQTAISQNGQELLFATNGGIFNYRFDPVGLLVENGITLAPLNLRRSVGNFYLQPNGVCSIYGANVALCVSNRYPASSLPDVAIQSGPMLVIDGAINPNFDAHSTNRTIRSGVGIADAHHIVFAISDGPVTFAEFAALFRDRLGCSDALYLDGTISRMFVAGSNEADDEQRFATLLVVTQ